MTNYELWNAIMDYGEFDRIPVIHWGGWTETTRRWQQEGMPEKVNQHEYFDAVPFWFAMSGLVTPVYMRLNPLFEEVIHEETDEYKIFKNPSGIVMQTFKNQSSVPHSIDFTFKTAADWPEYKKRLQPDPARIPKDFSEIINKAESSGNPISLPIGSLMGWIRDWMGVENMCYLAFDSPDCFADVVNTISDLSCWALDQIVPMMKNPPDLCFVWEDICGSTGPFVSPDIFNKYVAPGYLKIRHKMDEHGIKYLCTDSDGNVEALIKPLMDAGVNVLFPIEQSTWDLPPERIRKEYGKNLRLMGGLDKLVLEKDRDAIDNEITKHISLVKDGGYIMAPDHLITPDTPLDNYKYYLDKIRNLRF